MPANVFLSDICLLQKIYLEQKLETCLIYDPENRLDVDVNQPFQHYEKEQPIDSTAILVLLHPIGEIPKDVTVFDFTNTLKNQKTNDLYFINNPDGTIRWVFPKHLKQPDFLHLYNASSLKAKLFKSGVKQAFKFGLKKTIASGELTVCVAHKAKKIRDKDILDCAVFTGTKGENRKAIATLCEEGLCKEFAKIAITPESEKLIFIESQQLGYLSKFKFKNLHLPTVNLKDNVLMVGNVKPTKEIEQQELSSIHLKALAEMYAVNVTAKPLNRLQIYHDIEEWINNIMSRDVVNDIDATKCKRLAQQLLYLLKGMEVDEMIPVAFAHGDFTPWNMYLAENSLHLFDWELSQKEMPLLMDSFHYIFQKHILIQRAPLKDIKSQIAQLELKAKDMIVQYNISFDLHYKLYLLYTISYYIPKYMVQRNLHQQAHWLMDTWEQAIEDCLSEQNVMMVSGNG